MAEPGESAWEVGRRRVLRDEGGSSWRNGIVVEQGGAVVACLFGYPLPDVPEPIDAAMPAMFVPLQELENLAPGTLVREHPGGGAGPARPRPWGQPAAAGGSAGPGVRA